ncbi:MAG TPA: ribosome silencing factor [Rubricoccaceae bacterium]|nr:ribosome silencing factor [Rubricoccaceae bacterium]
MAASSPSVTSARARRTGPVPGRELARLAVDAALDKKAKDVTVMDLRGISGEVDYFVLATGESDLQIRAVVDGIVERLRQDAGERPLHREGAPGSSRWIVLDYFDLVVHVFDPELRAYYALERLWGDAPMEHVAEDAEEVALLRDDA